MNTKITFYYTDFKYGEFRKTIFETIIEGIPFEDINDAIEWEENDIFDSIWSEFDFSLIFDRIVMGYEETEKPIKDVEIIKHEVGTLTFGKKKIKKSSKDLIISESKSIDKSLEEIEKSIDLYREETKKIGAETEQLREERLGLEKKTKEIEKSIDVIKSETKKIVAETKIIKRLKKKEKEKKEYTSCWIEPDGTVHELAFAQHNEFASVWLQERIGLSAMVHDSRYAYEQLQEDFGWLRILGWSDPPSFVFPLKFTPKQKIAVRDYCMRERIDVPERLKS